MKRPTLIACVLIVSLDGVACGDKASGSAPSDGGAPSSGGGPSDRAALREAVVNAICGNATPCCERAGLPFKAACEARVRPSYSNEFGTDASAFDSALASGCLDIITAEIKACSFRTLSGPATRANDFHWVRPELTFTEKPVTPATPRARAAAASRIVATPWRRSRTASNRKRATTSKGCTVTKTSVVRPCFRSVRPVPR
jgi:hypothetical protein